MQKLISLSSEVTQFEANGVTYYVESQLSIARYRMFQRFQREIVTGISHIELIELLKTNCENVNGFIRGKDTLGQLYADNINALNQANNLEAKEPFEVWISTLFCNTQDEDRRKFEIPVMQEKIRNWEEAGIDMDFFISCAEDCCGLPRGSLKFRTLTYLAAEQTTGESDPDQPESD